MAELLALSFHHVLLVAESGVIILANPRLEGKLTLPFCPVGVGETAELVGTEDPFKCLGSLCIQPSKTISSYKILSLISEESRACCFDHDEK